ncbi:MAG: hypothetical protein A2137_04795 [Chloroflexi bacterium RBG_16_58_8]|nr:MAG: hypothetical protein A2137_04795 [Chloroflexi bacterium RBG_16_58_8]
MAKKKKAERPQREFTRRQLSAFKRQKRRQRIIFIGGVTVVAAIIVVILVGWVMSEYIPLRRTVLQVNDAELKMAYYVDALKISQLSQPQTDIQQLAPAVLEQLRQREILTQAAVKIGVTVTNEEARQAIEQAGFPVTDGGIRLFKSELLSAKLKSAYFEKQVGDSGLHVRPLITMLEGPEKAREIRERLVNGDNFTALAEEFSTDYYSKNINKGDFGLRPRGLLKDQLSSAIPLDFAFSAGVGELSQPLSDNETYKQLGYWLIRVNNRQEEGSANVSAVLISDLVLAGKVKARLEAGEPLGPIADELSNYSPSKENHGELGILTDTQNVTTVFNKYVWQSAPELGKWSDPILETDLWSQGGAWLVKVLEREENRPYAAEDKQALVGQALNDWLTRVFEDPTLKVVDGLLTDDMQQWAIDHVTKYVESLKRRAI